MEFVRKKIAQKFPTYGEKNIFWFYFIAIFGNAWFQIGNWLLYVLLFMGAGEFAVYESIAFAAGIMLEIPSGAIADLWGRKRTVSIGIFMNFIGSALFTLGYLGNEYFFFGNLIIIMGFALISGSLEALVYDTLVEKKKVQYYDDIIGKGHSLNILSLVVAGAIGGLLWRYSIYAPWIITTISFGIAFLATFKLKEPKVDTETFTIKNFFKQNKRGFHYLFKSDFRKYTFSLAIIAGSYLMWSAGIVRVLMGRDFGYDGESLSYLISVTLIAGFFATYYFKAIRKKLGDKHGFSILLLMSAVAWIATGVLPNTLALGVVVFMGITIAGSLSKIWSSVILNSHVLSKDRATAISTLSFFVQIPYVLVVVLYGTLIVNGNAEPFYVVTGILLIFGLISFYRAENAKVIVK